MKLHLKFTALLCAIGTMAFSQIDLPAKNDAQFIVDHDLVVEVKEVNPSILEAMDSDQAKTAYKKQIASYNRIVKEVMPTTWKKSKQVEFMTSSEINSMSAEQRANVAVFTSNDVIKEDSYTKSRVPMTGFRIHRTGEDTKFQEIQEAAYVTDIELNKADVILAAKILQNGISHTLNGVESTKDLFDLDKTLETLSNKTLLVEATYTNDDAQKIKKKYEYPFKLTDSDEINKAIVEADDAKTFVRLCWSASKTYIMYFAFDAASCEIVSIVHPGGVKVSLGAREKAFQVDQQQMEQDRNNNIWRMDNEYTVFVPRDERTTYYKFTIFESSMSFDKKHFNALDHKKTGINY